MRKFIVFLLPVALILLITSCDRNSCEDVVCAAANTFCYEGQCICEIGYEGDFCTDFTYQKYVGNYQVSQNCTSTVQGNQNLQYNSFISQGGYVDRVTISSFAGQYVIEGYFVAGTNGNQIYIPEQSIFGNTTIVGNGIFYPNVNRIEFTFSITQGGNYQECTAIYQRL